MVYINQEFREYCYGFFPKYVKDFHKKDDKITANVQDEEVIIVVKKPYLIRNCTCNERFCRHMYNTLMYDSSLTNKKDNENLKNSKYKLNKAFNNTLNGEKYKKPIKKGILTQKLMKDFKVLDEKTYIEITDIICNFDFDSYVNMKYRKNNSFETELSNLIYLHIDFLLYSKEYEIAFKIMKRLYSYLMNLESILEGYLEEYVKHVIKQFNKLVKKSKNTQLENDIFDWLLSEIRNPGDNILLDNIRTLLIDDFNNEEQLYGLEELTLHMIKYCENYDIENFIDDYGGYYFTKMGNFEGYLEELEYWFSFHLTVIKKLKYDKNEIFEFLKLYSHIPSAKFELANYYDENNMIKEKLNTYKEIIKDETYAPELRLSLLDDTLNEDIEFKNSEEYLEIIKQLIFDDRILADNILADFLRLDPNSNDYVNYFHNIIGRRRDFPKSLTRLNEMSKNHVELLRLIEYEMELEYIIKYGDILIKKYPKKFLDIVEGIVFEWMDYQKDREEDVNNLLKFLDKYDESKELINTIMDYCEGSNNKKLKKIYTQRKRRK